MHVVSQVETSSTQLQKAELDSAGAVKTGDHTEIVRTNVHHCRTVTQGQDDMQFRLPFGKLFPFASACLAPMN